MNSFVVGVDIGGSHITAALIDLEKRQIRQDTVSRQMVDSNGSLQEIISSWSLAIKKCIETISGQEIFIGIAMPGPFDYQNGICYIKEQNKFNALYGVNVKEALAAELDIAPGNIQFLNDAASFLKGEVFGGAAQNHHHVFGVTLGTGLGSALYKMGKVTDANLWCSLFKEGIAEDYFSTRWFVQRYADKTGGQIKNVKELTSLYPDNIQVKEIFAEFGEHLASFFWESFPDEQPEMVVLGGNISHSFDYFYPSLQKSLKDLRLDIIIKKSSLNEDASLLGAASCWSKTVEAKGNLLL